MRCAHVAVYEEGHQCEQVLFHASVRLTEAEGVYMDQPMNLGVHVDSVQLTCVRCWRIVEEVVFVLYVTTYSKKSISFFNRFAWIKMQIHLIEPAFHQFVEPIMTFHCNEVTKEEKE